MKEFTVKVEDKALSKALQEVAFENGYSWSVTGKQVKHYRDGFIINKEEKVLYNDYENPDYTLPQDWDKVVELIKKSNEPDIDGWCWFSYLENDDNMALVLCKDGEHTGYGFIHSYGRLVRWLNDYKGYGSVFKRRATKEEIEDALIEEAKRRGFKRGVTMKPIYGDSRPKVKIINDCVSDFKYFIEDDDLRISGGVDSSIHYGASAITIYKDGKWAEIIEDSLEIAGCEVKQSVNSACIKIGYKEVRKLDIDDFITLCDRFDVQTITTNHGDVTKQELKELRKRFL